LKLTNRSTGESKIVTPDVWESYLKSGRSRYWSAEPVEKTPSKPKVKDEPEKEEIKIQPIKVKPKKEENKDETN